MEKKLRNICELTGKAVEIRALAGKRWKVECTYLGEEIYSTSTSLAIAIDELYKWTLNRAASR